MSYDRALSEARELKRIMGQHGVDCSIELKVGRPNPGGSDWWTRKYVSMNHHTAGPSTGLTPTYSLVRNGYGALPGPLANGYGGRDLVYRIITMGLANHPGEGGPLTVAGYWVPKDSARPSCWGTEWEHDGTSSWAAVPGMKDFMARSNAALLEWMDRPVSASIEHKTWAPDRKIDRNNYTAEKGQEEIQAYLDSRDWFVMATKAELKDALSEVLTVDNAAFMNALRVAIEAERAEDAAAVWEHELEHPNGTKAKAKGWLMYGNTKIDDLRTWLVGKLGA